MRSIYGALAFSLLAWCGCSKSTPQHPGGGGSGGTGGGDLAVPDAPDMTMVVFNDWPPTPVLDPTGMTPAGAGGLFGPPSSGSPTGGPCLLDPEPGSLLPQNWLRPRFRLTPMTGQNLFEMWHLPKPPSLVILL